MPRIRVKCAPPVLKWFVVVPVLVCGCYAHTPSHTPKQLPQIVTGTHIYDVRFDGRSVGWERIEHRKRDAWFCVSGSLSQAIPQPILIDYRAIFQNNGIRQFAVRLKLAGLAQTTTASVTPDGLRIQTRGPLGSRSRVLAHGPGTGVDLGSPLSGLWAIQLVPEAGPGKVRTVVVRAPTLWPQVELIEFARSEPGAVQVHGPGREVSRFFQLDDGFPVRAETTWPGLEGTIVRIQRPISSQSSGGEAHRRGGQWLDCAGWIEEALGPGV
ncbi:MAG: hypothetical protein ACFB9M_14250 [Myxococcota bacterium]